MAATEKTKLVEEIEVKIQSLNLLLSTIKANRSGKAETIDGYRKQYYELLNPKGKNGK